MKHWSDPIPGGAQPLGVLTRAGFMPMQVHREDGPLPPYFDAADLKTQVTLDWYENGRFER